MKEALASGRTDQGHFSLSRFEINLFAIIHMK